MPGGYSRPATRTERAPVGHRFHATVGIVTIAYGIIPRATGNQQFTSFGEDVVYARPIGLNDVRRTSHCIEVSRGGLRARSSAGRRRGDADDLADAVESISRRP